MGSHKFAVFENFTCAYLNQIVSEMLLPILIYHPLVTLMLHASLRTPHLHSPQAMSWIVKLIFPTCTSFMFIEGIHCRE